MRLGTRGSELARTQSGTVAAALEQLGFDVELTIIKTAGDREHDERVRVDRPARRVRRARSSKRSSSKRIELAVHSFKDLPTKSPAELVIGAVPTRVDPADLLLVRRDAVARRGRRLAAAASRRARRHGVGARRALAQALSPDLVVEPLRGNVPTRVRTPRREGQFDAIVLAAAGVERLQAEQRLGSALDGVTVLRLDPQRFVPAPAQGALAVQCRRDDARVLAALARSTTRRAASRP